MPPPLQLPDGSVVTELCAYNRLQSECWLLYKCCLHLCILLSYWRTRGWRLANVTLFLPTCMDSSNTSGSNTGSLCGIYKHKTIERGREREGDGEGEGEGEEGDWEIKRIFAIHSWTNVKYTNNEKNMLQWLSCNAIALIVNGEVWHERLFLKIR